MTDGEILKLILDKVTNLESDMHKVNSRLETMDNRLETMDDRLETMDDRLETMDDRLETMDDRLDAMDNRLEKLESEVSALKTGQVDIRKDIKRIDQKVSDTYNLALETWGTSVENRKWLETLN